MRKLIGIVLMCVIVASCKKQAETPAPVVEEDKQAKAMLQGIWVNDDDEEVAFRVKGDTIYYPDSTSLPVHFMIVADTLVLKGSNEVHYPIEKQTEHLFVFKNQNGDEVKLVKSENPDDALSFEETARPQALNQRQLIKRDTVVMHAGERYHCYVQVNPTTYKVMKRSYSDEGVAVENIYYDNIIHISVFHGAVKVFSKDFYKKDFTRQVPDDFLRQSVLSDFIFKGISATGVHYDALLCIPDSPSSFVVDVAIGLDGKMTMTIAE